MDDPVIRGLILFSWRYWKLIAALSIAGMLGGLVSGFFQPVRYVGRSVVISATLGNEATTEALDVTAERLERHVAQQILDGVFTKDTSLRVRPILGGPPHHEKTNLLELVATAATEQNVGQCLDLTAKGLIVAQASLMLEEQTRLQQHMTALKDDLERTMKRPVTADNHATFVEVVRELVDSYRLTSPVRSYAPGILGVDVIKKQDTTKANALRATIGFLGGMTGAYALAFLVAGVRTVKGVRRRRSLARDGS